MGESIFHGGSSNQLYVSLNLIFCLIATLASILTLMLIRKMQVRTGHVTLIFFMTVFQLLYDCTLFFSNVNCGYYVTAFANFCQVFGGISSSLISNWIAFIAYFIIIYRQRFDIFHNFNAMMISACLPGFVNGIVYLCGMIPKSNNQPHLVYISLLDMYYYIRLASIFLNFLFCGIAFYKVQLISSKKLESQKSVQETAIRTLALRMVYYPIVQAISRSGYAWYEMQYGLHIDQVDANPTQYASLIFLTIITPSVSIGYLVIFLVMQPDAYRTFRAMMLCKEPRDSFDEGDEGPAEVMKGEPSEANLSEYTNGATFQSDSVPKLSDAPPSILTPPPSELHRNHGSRPFPDKLICGGDVAQTTNVDLEQGDTSTVINPLRTSTNMQTGGNRSTLGMSSTGFSSLGVSSMGLSSAGVHSENSMASGGVRVKRSRRKTSKRDMRDDEELIRIIADHEHLNRNNPGMLDRMKSIVPFSNRSDSARKSELGRSTLDEDDGYYRTHMQGDSMVLAAGQKLSIFSRASTSSIFTDGANTRNSAGRLVGKGLRWSQSSIPEENDVAHSSQSVPGVVARSSVASDVYENQTL